jgi:O-antigen/teichoic acid export membrane protein
MSLRRHTIYNLGGAAAPVVLGVVVVPVYLHIIGPGRYGVLSLVWLVVGYFGLFDLGLARATAYHVARAEVPGAAGRNGILATAAALNAGLGLAGGAVLFVLLPVLFGRVVHLPAAIAPELAGAAPWIAAAVPMALLNGVVLGTLEGRERFGRLNFAAGLAAVFLQLGPLAVAYEHGPSLAWLIPAVVLARAASLAAAAALLLQGLAPGGFTFQAGHAKSLLRYGGWITLSSVAGNLLVALDRLLIGAGLGVVAVAYYAVPYNLVSRASILPGAVATSLFPRLARQDDAQSAATSGHAVSVLAAVFTPVIVAGLLAMPKFMTLWVGAAFARQALPVALILLVGIWANGLAFVPFSHLQAGARANRSGWLHVVELPLFAGLLWLGLRDYGVVGAAVAWSIRAGADAGAIFWLAGQAGALRPLWPGALLVAAAAVLAAVLPAALFWAGGAAVFGLALAWSCRLAPGLFAKMLPA